MPTKFDDYVREVEERAKADGPKEFVQWNAFNAHFPTARRIRLLRKERHLTQGQLAAASGISRTEISRIERDHAKPTASTLAAVLAPLGAVERLDIAGARERVKQKASVPVTDRQSAS